MQYEWTPPQLFFCRYCVLQLFCHNVERAHEIKCSQKQLEVKFCYFRDLGLIIPENRTFYRTPQNASVSKQFLALYFAIIYSRQFSSSKKSLVGKIVHPYISRNLQISFTQIFFSFSLTDACLRCRLRKARAVL